MCKCLKVVSAAAVAACGLFALSASAEPAFQARLTVRGYAGVSPLADFPVLVRLSSQTVAGFDGAACEVDGSDLQFVNDVGDVYPHEIDTWNPLGESLVWVKLPQLAKDESFFVQWGGGTVASSNASRTWNDSYAGVWHMGEEDGVCANSTRHGSVYDATPMGETSESVRYDGDDAPVGGARTTAKTRKSYLSVPSPDACGHDGVFTISGWVRLEASSGYFRLFSRKTTYTGTGWEAESNGGSMTQFTARGRDATPSVSFSLPAPGLLTNWVHLAFVYDKETLSVYGNGEPIAQGAIRQAKDNGLPFSIGCNSNGTEAFAKGAFDECRLMGGAASADWVKAEHDTAANRGFLAYDVAESLASSADPTLRLTAFRSSAVADASADFAAYVRGLGEGAASATLTLSYGFDAASLDRTQEVGAIDRAGRAEFRLSRLLPGRTYFVRLVVRNDLGQSLESGVLRVKTAVAPDGLGEPGLNQTFFTQANAKWDKSYAELPQGTDWRNYKDDNRIYRRELGVLAAYLGDKPGATKRRSEVWGDEVYWPESGGQWVYWGQMHLEGDKSYLFRMNIDDCERVKVTDPQTGNSVVLLDDDNNSSGIVTSAPFVPTAGGWHPIEIRLSDGTGNAGGYTTTDDYLNTQNIGWSDDGGKTWNLMMDEGDGSLFLAGDSASVSVKEVISGGALQRLDLTFLAATSQRDLLVVWGPVHGGDTLAGWANTNRVATIAAGQADATVPLPPNWGADDSLVLRCCLLDGARPVWSPSVYWRDVADPEASLDALDGRMGDTLKVTGDLKGCAGWPCTLTVLVGPSEDEMTQAWTGLAGSVRPSPGAFELTLFEPDASSPKYLTPAETYFVCIEAEAGGRRTRSQTKRVTMARDPAFDAVSAAVSRRTVTFRGRLRDAGMGDEATVSLWVGDTSAEASLVQVETPIAVSNGEFEIVHVFPAFDRDYSWQLRASATSGGGTATAETRTAVATCRTLDTTSYTWTGAADSDWGNPANWSDGQANGDSCGYPQSSAATVIFPPGTTARYAVNQSLTVGRLDLSAAGVTVTFTRGATAGSATPEISATSLQLGDNRVRLALEGVALKLTGSPNVAIGADCEVRLLDGARWTGVSNLSNVKGGSLLLAPGTSLACGNYHFGGGLTEIDDATVDVGANSFIGSGLPGGVIRFLGTHPLYRMNWGAGEFRASLAGSGVRLAFAVPAGGYETAPIQKTGASTVIFGYSGNARGEPITVEVLPDSPAKYVDATCTTTLVSWPAKGLDKTLLVEGALPDASDAFVWSEEEWPLTLGVRLVGSTHANELVVKGEPESFPCASLSPGYGAAAVASGETLTCTAPAGPVEVSETKRVTCVGWKLYAVDVASLTRTLVDEGAGTSCAYTNTDGRWHELVWQWKVEYRVTATSAGHGTASVESEWLETGKKARVTVTPDAGYGFGKWTGDVPADHDKDFELRFTVRDRAYAFEASFLPVVYVRPDGGDDNDGKTLTTAFATIGRALQEGPDVYVLLADGTYEVTNQIILANGSTVAGANPGAKAVVKLMKSLPGEANAPGSIFKLAHADARLYNLTVTTDYEKGDSTVNAYGAQRKGDFGRGVWIESAGLVDSCVITNCRSKYCPGYGGGGVYLKGGGIVRRSLLTHNTTYASGGNNAQGHAVMLDGGGLVESCSLLWGGSGQNDSSSSGVRINGKDATVRNCLVAFCTHGHDNAVGSGVWVTSGTLENCTVAGNFHRTSSRVPGLSAEWSAVIRNCVVWGNENAAGVMNSLVGSDCTVMTTCTTPLMAGLGNVDGDPLFADAAAGDFRLEQLDFVDAGLPSDWMDWTGDLDGRDRVQGAAPDMGCYEMTPQALSCSFSVAARGILDVDTVTLTARVMGTDLAGLAYEWTLTDQAGATIVTNVADATLTLPVPARAYPIALKVTNAAGETATLSRPGMLTVSPRNLYVDGALDGPGVYPYGSRATATPSLQAALDAAADGSVIHVAPGRYEPEDALKLTRGVTLVSDDGPSTVEIYCAVKTVSAPILSLSHPRAMLSGVTVTGRDADGKRRLQWGAIRMQAGVVTNCFIVGHETQNNCGLPAACRLEGGTVVDCTISNNLSRCSGGAGFRGGVVQMNGGDDALLDRCTIVDNETKDGSVSYGGGVYLKAGTVRNCFFARNYVCDNGGAIALEGTGRVLGCTVVRNRARSLGGGIWQGGGTVRDCLLYANESAGLVEDVDDPGFVDAANGDYHLSVASPAVDAAEGTDLGDFDREGLPRVSGSAADKGCYELDRTSFAIGIVFEKLTPFAPGKVRFSARTTVDDLSPEACWWTFDGSEPTAENHAATGLDVERTLGVGPVTVRFRATYGGQTYAIDKADWFMMYGETVHVVPESANPVFPYATRETATSDFDEAFAAVRPNGTILIDDGTYSLPRERTIAFPMTVRSVNGPEKTVLDAGGKYTAFILDDPGAVLDGLTIRNGRAWANAGGASVRKGGQVLNCTFDACSGRNVSPAAIDVSGAGKAVVRNCRFVGCWWVADGYVGGGRGVVIRTFEAASDALIENCLVLGAREVRGNSSVIGWADGAVFLEAGTLRNTVVAGSVLRGCGGIVVGGQARVENCTVLDNVSTNETASVAGVRIDSAGATVVNTLVWGNRWLDAPSEVGGVDGFERRLDRCWTTGDPQLRGRGAYPYRPAAGSPCIDAGRQLPWMDGAAVDFYGRPRKQGKGPDIGAAESRSGGFTLIVR